MAILRQAKYPGDAKPLIIQYQLARNCISACLVQPETMNRTIAEAVAALEQRHDDPANRPLVRDDARRCIEVITTFQRTVNALSLWNGVRYEPATQRPAPLSVSGVEISVFPDAVSFRSGARVGQTYSLHHRRPERQRGEPAPGGQRPSRGYRPYAFTGQPRPRRHAPCTHVHDY